MGEESSVGKNSRLLLGDGTIYWVGSHADAVRPTGPFDPELPVHGVPPARWRLRGDPLQPFHAHHRHAQARGSLALVLRPGRPGGREGAGGDRPLLRGGLGIDSQPGRAGRRGDLSHQAGGDRRAGQGPRPADRRIQGARKEIALTVRKFDEAAADRQVAAYCTKRIPDPKGAQSVIDTFRAMRKVLSPRQGEVRKTWVQAIILGDVAIVGVPGEFFTLLGQEIKRRSPYRYTFVFELANDYVGYIPDTAGFDRGGYQVWMGLHSFLERGSGEIIVDEAVRLLEQLHDQDSRPVSR